MDTKTEKSQDWVERQNKLQPNKNYAILITGATSGLGLGLAKYYHKLGFTIIGGYYNQAEPGYEELTILSNEFGRIHLIPMDVRSPESIKKARQDVDMILDHYDQLKLYCLVNNAGIAPSAVPLHMESRNCIKAVCETNFMGPVLLVREFMPLLIECQGRIVNISSGLAKLPGEHYAIYGATKAALYFLTRCMRKETDRYGVKTLVILPGNLLKNTNIANGILILKKQAREEFDQDEQLLYNRIFRKLEDLSTKETDSANKYKNGETKSEPYRITNLITMTNNSLEKKNQSVISKLWNSLKLYILDSIEVLLGACNSKIIEESSIMEAFDDAIRSPKPYRVLFAGNRWYQFMLGPCSLLVPDALYDFLLFYFSNPKKEKSVVDYIKRRSMNRTNKLV